MRQTADASLRVSERSEARQVGLFLQFGCLGTQLPRLISRVLIPTANGSVRLEKLDVTDVTQTGETPGLGCLRSFTAGSTPQKEKPLPPRLKLVETDLDESFLKGSGPGGQKINKTSSAVQLKHLPTGIVVKSQETRSRQQNRKLARLTLAEKLDHLEKGDESRTTIKSERARVKKASASKKTRRKYKKLAEEDVKDGVAPAEPAEDADQDELKDAHASPDIRATEPEPSKP
ncbi:hypothetical protein LTR85_008110 [Meristemomyces frigidus]|nr:hypothetical protein LTR85_008110 [Meristemomyces frigidus]